MRRSIPLLGILCIAVQFDRPARGQVIFSDVSAANGIGPYQMADGMGAGVAAEDFDGDGDIDLFVPTAGGFSNLLYRNLGNGQFEQIAAQVGLASTTNDRNALWLDYDGDGDLDLFVTNDVTGAPSAFRLYRREAGLTFTDVTAAAGLFLPSPNPGMHHRGGNCAGDLNGDGWLDIVAAIWNGTTHVFFNNRNGTFSSVGQASGIGIPSLYAHQPMMADFNGDGWLDVHIAIDFAPDVLWINQKNGTFVNIGIAAGVGQVMNDMGMTLGDYDNDGDLDIYRTNIYMNDPVTLLPEYNLLLRNDSSATQVIFTDVSHASGVEVGYWGWGTTFLDCDNDGHLDIAATNGWRSGSWLSDPSRLFRNNGASPPVFADISNPSQFNDTYYGACLITTDLDRDGDLDLIQACQSTQNGPSRLRLLKCDPSPGPSNHYLSIRPRIAGPNSHAAGAVVRAYTGAQNQMRLITAGTSYMGQEPAEAHFGLGNESAASLVLVEWPDGTVTALNNVAADQIVDVLHGGFGDLNADGVVDDDDVSLFLPCYTGPGAGGIIYVNGCRASDIDADGDVDCQDAGVLMNAYVSYNGEPYLMPLSSFVAALLAPQPFENPLNCFADVNIDGAVNGKDIKPYTDALLTP